MRKKFYALCTINFSSLYSLFNAYFIVQMGERRQQKSYKEYYTTSCKGAFIVYVRVTNLLQHLLAVLNGALRIAEVGHRITEIRWWVHALEMQRHTLSSPSHHPDKSAVCLVMRKFHKKLIYVCILWWINK